MKLASNMRAMRVGRRILLQILLLVAVVSALLSVASFLENRSAMLTNTQDTLTARAGESAKTIAAAIENKRFILKNIATLLRPVPRLGAAASRPAPAGERLGI
jgi:cell division protein YceG involved in septum cleavage